jgi:hypothetical protein
VKGYLSTKMGDQEPLMWPAAYVKGYSKSRRTIGENPI